MFAAAALAVLTKGLIGVVIPGAVVALYLLFTRRWRLLGGAVARRNPALPRRRRPLAPVDGRPSPRFLWFYFVHEHLLRYATDATHRWQPVSSPSPCCCSGSCPGRVCRRPRRRWATTADRRGGSQRRPALVFLACWAGFVFVFFSASRSKLIPYVLPALPPLAVLTGLAVAAAAGATRGSARVARAAGAIGAGLALAARRGGPGVGSPGRFPSSPDAWRRSPSPPPPWRRPPR